MGLPNLVKNKKSLGPETLELSSTTNNGNLRRGYALKGPSRLQSKILSTPNSGDLYATLLNTCSKVSLPLPDRINKKSVTAMYLLLLINYCNIMTENPT